MRLALLALLAFCTASAGPLSLPDVLDSVDARIPALAAADARVDEADAEMLAERGAFDPTLVGKTSTYGGKSPRTAVDVGARAATPWGPEVAVGWTRGVGDFPPYALDAETGPSGEVYGRVTLPVLAGLGFGKDRAALEVARAGRAEKRAAREDVERKVNFEASKRYWAWVAAAMDLRVAEEQLDLAQRRQDALVREVAVGSRAPLDQVDNERVLGERTADVADAGRKLELAALALSLFLRDPSGAPRVVSRGEAPPTWPAPEAVPVTDAGADTTQRPDRAKLDAELQALAAYQRRMRNALRPEVKVSAGVYQPLDADRKPEIVGGLSFEAPVAFREALGDRRAADARAAAAQAELRALDDAIRAEIAGAFQARRFAEQRAEAARSAAERAGEVVRLERRRFELGGSDLFQLLQREDALAKARKAAVEAEYALRIADAALRAAITGTEPRESE